VEKVEIKGWDKAKLGMSPKELKNTDVQKNGIRYCFRLSSCKIATFMKGLKVTELLKVRN